MDSARSQVILTGAGIAGLWSLRTLLDAGYDAILVEAEAIGCRQTLASQGILHGGVKYGLDGTKRDIAGMLRSMPAVWEASLRGEGTPSLAAAVVNAPCQHLWAAPTWLARAGATVGARMMEGEVRRLDRGDWPAALRDGGHRGSVYRLDEKVLDVRSVLEALAGPVRDRIFRGAVTGFEPAADGAGLRAIRCGELRLEADVFAFTAATGNEAAAEALGYPATATQRRPLRQILLRAAPGGPPLPPLWGHCVTASPKPVFTVTTHALPDGGSVWYLGGGVAEDGVGRSEDEVIAGARTALRNAFPSFAFGEEVEWACFDVDRAEPGAGNRLPDGPAVLDLGNAALAWPAKLVYAPELAARVLRFVESRVSPAGAQPLDRHPLPPAATGRYPWESAAWRSVAP